MTEYEQLREKLAEYAHDAWAGWMLYMSSKIEQGSTRQRRDRVYLQQGWLPSGLIDRWNRQMNTPYSELPESEKESDRAEADKILNILQQVSPQLRDPNTD